MFFNPRRYFAALWIRQGTVPLWNPLVGCGVPFLANLQSSVFYPLGAVYYLLPFQFGFELFIVFHYFLAGSLMYVLMRHWRHSPFASLLAAVTFMCGGYLVSIMDNVAFLTSAVWLPLAVTLWDRFLYTGRFSYSLGTGAVISLQILGGDFSHYVLSTFIVMLCQFLFWLARRSPADRSGRGRRALGLPAAWAVGLGLAMCVLLPFLEFAYHSTRMEGIDYEVATRWSYHPFELLQLITPYFFGSLIPFTKWLGQAWIDTVYFGIAPLCLALFGILCSTDPRRRLLLSILFISLFLALGKYNPIFEYIYRHMPGMQMMKIPAKFLFLAAFSLAVMVGMGWESVFRKIEAGEEIKVLKLLLIFLNLLLLAGFAGALLWREPVLAFLRDYLARTDLKAFYTPDGSYATILENISTALVVSALTTFVFGLALMKRLSTSSLKILLLAITVVELTFIAKPHDQLIPSRFYGEETDTSRRLPPSRHEYRTFSLTYLSIQNYMNHPRIPFTSAFRLLRNSLIPNLQVYDRIATVGEFSAIMRADYTQVLGWVKHSFEKVRGQNGKPDSYRLKQERASSCKKILDLMNVRFLVSPHELHGSPFKDMGTGGGGVRIYENAGALPRAFLVTKAILMERAQDTLPVLGNDLFEPHEFIVLSREDIPPWLSEELMRPRAVSAEGFRGTARIVRYEPNIVNVEVETNGPCFLVLSESYFPGWRTRVNGKDADLLKANFFLRGIRIKDAGTHHVELVFTPLSYTLGKYVSFLTLVLLVIGLLVRRKERHS
jgi:hypothetical protein